MTMRPPHPFPFGIVALVVLVALLSARVAAAQTSVLDVTQVRARTVESGLPLEVALRLSPASEAPVTVRVQTVDVTATGSVDYVPVNDVVTFPPGATTASVSVIGVDDALDEDRTESLMVLLSESRGALLGAPSVELVIEDDDEEISVTAVSGKEGDSAQLILERAWPSVLPVSFELSLEPGTAVAGDYVLAEALAQFAPDDLTVTLEVPLIDDGLDEPTETFTARFGVVAAPAGGTAVLPPQVVPVSIVSDEACAPAVADRAFCAEVTGEVSRVLEGPFVRRDAYIGHAPSSESCLYRTRFRSDDGWTVTLAMDLPHLSPDETYPVRTPLQFQADGNAWTVRGLVEGAVRVAVVPPGGDRSDTYYGTSGTLTFSAFDARFGRHEGRPVVGRLRAELERYRYERGENSQSEGYRAVVIEAVEPLGRAAIDLRFASDQALIPRQDGDCGRPD